MHPLEKYSKENICMCVCHVKNVNCMHVAPCCKNTYKKYLELDENGNKVFNKNTSIEIEPVIEERNGVHTIIYTSSDNKN